MPAQTRVRVLAVLAWVAQTLASLWLCLAGVSLMAQPAPTNTLAAQPAPATPADEWQVDSPRIDRYQSQIDSLEAQGGPYAAGLAEQLQGLGLAYQNLGRHRDAAAAFKRGTYLARVRHGLNSATQIPLLQGLIESLTAVGDLSGADARQAYLYRIQRTVHGDGSQAMAQAMLRRADWEWRAYDTATGEAALSRLVTIARLYDRALENIAEREGPHSLNQVEALNGLLQAQHLLRRHWETHRTGGSGGLWGPGVPERSAQSFLGADSYKKGREAIATLRDIYAYNVGQDSLEAIGTLVTLGDWNLLHGKRGAMAMAYRDAWQRLGTLEDADAARRRFFGEPVLLPDLPGFRRDITPPVAVKGHAEVAFSVSPRGRVENLELLAWDGQDKAGARRPVKLLKKIKRRFFRPVMVEGELVAAETMTRRYAY